MKSIITCFFALLSCSILSCVSPPPADLVVANKMEADALVKVQESREIIIDAYEKELIAAYMKQLDMVVAEDIAKATSQEYRAGESQPTGRDMITVAEMKRIMAAKDEQRDNILKLMAVKRAEFMEDDNLTTAQKINAISSSWLKASADGAAQLSSHIDDILGAVKKKK